MHSELRIIFAGVAELGALMPKRCQWQIQRGSKGVAVKIARARARNAILGTARVTRSAADNVSVNINLICGCGGIGRRARFRLRYYIENINFHKLWLSAV